MVYSRPLPPRKHFTQTTGDGFRCVNVSNNDTLASLAGNLLSFHQIDQMNGEIKWTEEQSRIINAPPSAKVLVEAGPGTGKTAVACARVAKLLKEDEINPGSILMISFTRTAVAEMKNRIRLWADSGKVNAVNISTLDQAAFSFGIGCGDEYKKLMESFDGNIDNAVEMFESKHPVLLQYLSKLEHVIIDEAQDLIGARSDLAIQLLAALPASAGATIFADSAQSIYGFSDVDDSENINGNFLKTFAPADLGFTTTKLGKIHRTEDTKLLSLFTQTRKVLCRTNGNKVQDLIDVAKACTPCQGSDIQKMALQNGDLILYRKRASALMHAAFCPQLFRLRLPGHPPPIYSWLGLVFSDFIEPLITQQQFQLAWPRKVPQAFQDGFTSEAAWMLLDRFAGKRGDVHLARLRSILSTPRPPVEFCHVDYGSLGPIFSTIHASKGREAARVFLMLPRNLDYLGDKTNIDPEEEARVFYVGSTRVQKEFLRGLALTLVRSRRLEKRSERVIQLLAEDKLKFQVGLARDFDDLALISRDEFFCRSEAEAAESQNRLLSLWSKSLNENASPSLSAKASPGPRANDSWPFRVLWEDQTVAWSAHCLPNDLLKMRNLAQENFKGQRRTPNSLWPLRIIGLRTCVLGDDPAALGRIREPYATSGFWLAPMIVGFPSVAFPDRNAHTNGRRPIYRKR